MIRFTVLGVTRNCSLILAFLLLSWKVRDDGAIHVRTSNSGIKGENPSPRVRTEAIEFPHDSAPRSAGVSWGKASFTADLHRAVGANPDGDDYRTSLAHS